MFSVKLFCNSFSSLWCTCVCVCSYKVLNLFLIFFSDITFSKLIQIYIVHKSKTWFNGVLHSRLLLPSLSQISSTWSNVELLHWQLGSCNPSPSSCTGMIGRAFFLSGSTFRNAFCQVSSCVIWSNISKTKKFNYTLYSVRHIFYVILFAVLYSSNFDFIWSNIANCLKLADIQFLNKSIFSWILTMIYSQYFPCLHM